MTAHSTDSDGSLLTHCLELQTQYERTTAPDNRRGKGQFFTPSGVCEFMTSLLSVKESAPLRLLDPGAGVGALSAAICDRFLNLPSSSGLEIYLVENDTEVLPFLRETMRKCEETLQQHGHLMSYKIFTTDYILDAAAALFGPPTLFDAPANWKDFDAVIMNPPYYKVNKDSPYARVMQEVVHGQPNIYAFFLAAAAQMLRPDGELIAITPRSFCNGLYFREFRHWFFERMSLDYLHLFESRTETFRDVLQESLITKSHRLGSASSSVVVSCSHGPDLQSARPRTLATSAVIDDTCGHAIIRIPATEEDLAIAGVVESWPDRFSDLGLRISTGPVVLFRSTEYLLPEPDGKDSAPLLSVFNVKAFRTEWPITRKKHPKALRVCRDSQYLLLPTQNYVLLRRFSAKEERRRLTASCLLASDVCQPFVALENHLNYLYHAERELTQDEVYGLAAILNSSLLDHYFRTISGNTQVNATEIRSMRFPPLAILAQIGRKIRRLASLDSDAVERIIIAYLDIDSEIASHLLEGTLSGEI